MSNQPEIQIAFFGSRGVGKSAFLARLAHGRFIDEIDPTIDDTIQVEKNGIKFSLWDYSSREDFGARGEFDNLQKTTGIFLCFAHDDYGALREIQYVHEQLAARPESEKALDKPIFVVRCKCDLDASKKSRDVKFTLDDVRAWAAEKGFQYWETSAKENIRVDECFKEMIKRCKEVNPVASNDPEKRSEPTTTGRANCRVM